MSKLLIKLHLLILCVLTGSALAESPFNALNNFGENPGELTASFYQPKDSKYLLVLLHGCGQNAQLLAQDSGFLAQAKRHNISLLLPQQLKSNNGTLCFNWFSPEDQNKDSGEALSIINMIHAMKTKQVFDDVYIVGLSAGGAMVSNLMVHYSEMFSAGAVIAGIPYPCADNLIKAISCMKSSGAKSSVELAQDAKIGGDKRPNLVVITGSADTVVNPKNSYKLAHQWRQFKSLSSKKQQSKTEQYQKTYWGDEQSYVELIEVINMHHGLPVNSKVNNGGKAAPFLLDSGFSSAIYLSDLWFN